MNKIIYASLLGLGLLSLGSHSHAEQQFLPQSQAFVFSVRSDQPQQATLHWQIAPQYYLYQEKFIIQHKSQPLTIKFPTAIKHYDAYFGASLVYFDQVQLKIKVEPNQHYQVLYQGCAVQGLCYPISQAQFATDAEGLVIEQNNPSQAEDVTLFAPKDQQHSIFASAPSVAPLDQGSSPTTVASTSTVKPDGDTARRALQQPSSSRTTLQSDDQTWSNRLHQQALGWNILVFLGLGVLLAFTPCSLPMLPILSSLLVQNHRGVKAGLISLCFVLGMATVYALLGIAAASMGVSLGRWLQQPILLIGFALVFTVFAANLFGWFEWQLPQRWANRLDQLQSRQRGGTLVGATVMGMLSALLVGPCMTAPLAGTLLYISQSQQWLIGAALLFSLGIGMGLPLLILSVVGAHAIPRAGQWMYSVRHLFGFIMLGLAWYFIRPLLPVSGYGWGIAVLLIALSGYFIVQFYRSRQVAGIARSIYALISVIAVAVALRQSYSAIQQSTYLSQSQITWSVVRNADEFGRALAQAKQTQQPVIIDVYANWCVACQPIEQHIWPRQDVSQAVRSWQRIKIDLSQFDQTQRDLLYRWQILGPPTVLFLDANGVEKRQYRLTGEFDAHRLLVTLQQAQS